MNNYKKYFPIFEKRPGLIYLDSAATTLKPKITLDKMMEYYLEYSANIHRGLYELSERATSEYDLARQKVAEFVGAEFENEIIFTSGATSSINLVARSWGERNLKAGDEVVVTEMEHHSNLVPWQELSKKLKLKINFLEISNFKLQITNLEQKITERTKLLAITQVSNVLGTVNPIKEIIKKAKEINPEIVVVVDGAQAVGHMKVDVIDLDADFYVFSGHKMYGPTGVGVLYTKASRQLEMFPDNVGGGMIREVTKDGATWVDGPERFEAGTPPIAEVIGLGAAVDFINQIGMENVMKHENELVEYALKKFGIHNEIKIIGPKDDRTGVISMVFEKEDYGSAHDWSDILGKRFNVCTRAGHHCAMPLHNLLGLPNGTLRASIGLYNTSEDIDKLIEGLVEVKKVFEESDNG